MGNNEIDLNLLKTFSKVLELGSFTQAARLLKQPKSRVSKAIARLEKELGVALIQRTTRSVSATHAGKELFSNITHHLQGLEREAVAITEKGQKIEGVIRIAASEDIGHSILMELVQEFNQQYPQIQFEVLISNELINLQNDRIDLAFRISKMKDSTIVQKSVGQVELVLVATPSYLQKFGMPQSLQDLSRHRLLTFFKVDSHQDFDPLEELAKREELPYRTACNSFIILYAQAIKGRGIALLPDFYCRDDFKKGNLVRILPSFAAGKRNIHIIYPPAKNLPTRTRKFLDFSFEKLKGYFL